MVAVQDHRVGLLGQQHRGAGVSLVSAWRARSISPVTRQSVPLTVWRAESLLR
ncbi:hypothetical protein [Actinoplanes sp. NPDC049265]|uniref:hypothetical protein n=1 Tax=Actinoplanes sp. NPDC049265 TaxID=3363902 RepID=UPI00371FE111